MKALLSNKRGAARWAEEIFWFLSISLSFDAFVYMNGSANGYSATNNSRPWIGAVLISTYLLSTTSVFISRRMRLSRIDLHDWLLMGLPVFCFISVMWSVLPLETLKKSIFYLAYTGFVVATFLRLGFIGAYHRIWSSVLILMLLSILAVIVIPGLAVSHENHDGAWKGVFAHKNMLGAVAAFGLVVQFVLVKFGQLRFRGFTLLSSTILIVGLMGSRSSTAIIALAGALFSGVFWSIFSKRIFFKVRALLVAAIAIAMIFMQGYLSLASVAGFFGKDSTATGRLPLWLSAFEEASRRPFLGYGYGAYWIGEEGVLGRVRQSIGFEVSHSHNGYLELALAFGFIVPALALLALIFRIVNYLKMSDVSPSEAGGVISVLAFAAIYNISESAIAVAGGGLWMIFLLVWMYMNRVSSARAL